MCLVMDGCIVIDMCLFLYTGITSVFKNDLKGVRELNVIVREEPFSFRSLCSVCFLERRSTCA